MTPPRIALFLAGVFFGGGLDHVIFVATGSTRSHYGLTVGVFGQLAFATFDFCVSAVLCWAHFRWSRRAAA